MIMSGRGGDGGAIGGGGCRFPFTASQWQELEHQALIFKYMVSGVPIPPDLLFTIRRSLDSKLFAPHIGWNCFQLGVGRKIDPEPGRCRRTDGKKWRCSKEAFQDSKYCEKHMHRGKNRSRKPVEQVITSHLLTSMVKPTVNSNTITHSSLSSVTSDSHQYPSAYYTNSHHPYNHLHSSFSSSNSKVDSTHLGLDSGSYHRYNTNHGSVVKDVADAHSLFNEECGTVKSMEDSWQLTPLAMGSTCRRNSKDLQLQGQSHQYYEEMRDGDESTGKTVYRFLEERPPESKESWHDKSSSITQLSISIPATSDHVFNSKW